MLNDSPTSKTQTTDFSPSATALPDPQGQRVQKLGQHIYDGDTTQN